MLALEVEIAVLTSVELDHHSAFGSLLELERDYRAFLAGAPQAVIWERPELVALRAPDAATLTYDAPAPSSAGGGASFDYSGVEVRLAVPGAHNARNAAAAIATCGLVGIPPAAAAQALAQFTGAARRFERVGTSTAGAVVYDDYAHHPTEIAATLAAARTLEPARLIAAFQPHLYSRTRELASAFGAALAAADVAVVLDVYPAREQASDYPGVSGLLVAEAAADAAGGRPVYWLPRFADAEPVLHGLLVAGDLLVTMGAGDIDTLARDLVA
jgi:UDP-N-acetylmuramate--alanine ligase